MGIKIVYFHNIFAFGAIFIFSAVSSQAGIVHFKDVTEATNYFNNKDESIKYLVARFKSFEKDQPETCQLNKKQKITPQVEIIEKTEHVKLAEQALGMDFEVFLQLIQKKLNLHLQSLKIN